MANEITIGTMLTVRNGFLQRTFPLAQTLITQNTPAASGIGQTIDGTTPEALVITDISSAGWMKLKNVGTVATIQVGTGTGTSFVALVAMLPGEEALFRAATTSVIARSTTTNSARIDGIMLSG